MWNLDELFWRVLSRLLLPFLDKPLPAPSVRESLLCDELREKVRRYTPVDTEKLLPSEAAWIGYMNSIHDRVLANDPRDFLRWAPVALMMSPTRVSYFTRELRYLRRRPAWGLRWCKALRESPAGHPVPYVLLPSSSGNLIRHAYYVCQFEEKAGTVIQDYDYIFDFGGGYGCMCRLIHTLGFRGTYRIFDLPLFTYLQEFYLKSAGVIAPSPDCSGPGTQGISCISDFDLLTNVLTHTGRHTNSLFIATESFSEIPIAQREKFLPLIRRFDSFLITYSHKYREADNTKYFREWKEKLGPDIRWQEWQNDHRPDYTNLAGKRTAVKS